jgi:glutathione synthase/RimK-type ligase-like ATP-grasp enzyme
LNSHSGRGIIINNPTESTNLVRAPLYVKYKKKKKEFRVHVFNGQVIDLAEKRRFRQERRDESFVGLIRNHGNGWAFCRDAIVEPTGLRELAIQSVAALGLHFGACDIIWNEKENKCYSLEVNTAPGLQGTTLERYSQAIANYVTRGV